MRKAIFFVDESEECKKARRVLEKAKISFVEYDVRHQTEYGCCGGMEIKVPAVYAPEGIFTGINGIREYVERTKSKNWTESESAYW